jgi:hypothetical protein
MNELKQALRQAVEALTEVTCYDWAHKPASVDGNDSAAAMCDAAITAAEAALAQPEQEPVAWQHKQPVCDASGILIGYGAWEEGRGLEHWPTRALYASVPAQSAELAAVAAECTRLRAALRIAREGYASEAATGLPALPQWRESTIALIDDALDAAKAPEAPHSDKPVSVMDLLGTLAGPGQPVVPIEEMRP